MRYVEDFISAVKTRQAEIASSLTAGKAVNYESYKHLVGHHTGLGEALMILENLLKEDDDDKNK
jgi:hypothetical protein